MIQFSVGKTRIDHSTLVSRNEDCPVNCLIGTDFMKKLNSVTFDFNTASATLNHTPYPFQPLPLSARNSFHLKWGAETTVRKFTDNLIPIATGQSFPSEWEFLIEPLEEGSPILDQGLQVGKAICRPGQGGVFAMRLINCGMADITLHAGQKIASCELLSVISQPRPMIFAIQHTDPQKEADPLWQVKEASTYVPPEADYTAELPKLPSTQPEKGPVINLTSCPWPEVEKEKLKELLQKHARAFVGGDGRLGRYTGSIKHEINLTLGATPPKTRPYRIPLEKQEEVRKQIQYLIDNDLIEPSNSPFCAPIVLVKKADGKSWRFTVDYRKLNSITRKEAYLLPHIQDILDQTSGKEWYSTLDFQSGFFQLPMHPAHKERTAFSSFLGQFQFKVMPMGLCGAPTTFQRALNQIIQQLKACCFVYIDDLIVASESIPEHLSDLDELLTKVEAYGMTLRGEKCHFASSEVKYLGILVSKEGSRPDPKKISSITELPTPNTVHAVRSFLGACSYFRRFIKNFAKIAHPLSQLLKKDQTFEWKEDQESAFQNLNEALTTAPLLIPPTIGKPYQVHTDASLKGIGGCLLQERNGHFQPIAYASRTLNKHERRYPIIELEALAIVFSLKAFYPYVAEAEIVVVTDHSPLRSLMTRPDLTGRLAKYQITIQGFNLQILYRPGKWNSLCDMLSRYPIPGQETAITAPSARVAAVQTFSPSTKFDRKWLLKLQQSSPLREHMRYLKDGTIPDDDTNATNIVIDCFNYSLNEGLFCTIPSFKTPLPRCVIPTPEAQIELTQHFHKDRLEGGHFGIRRTLEKLKSLFYWPKMRTTVETVVRSCAVCQKIKTPSYLLNSVPLGSFPLIPMPFFRVHSDVVGPLPQSTEGHRYILLSICAFTKYAIATPLPDQTAKTLARAFVNDLICKHGVPSLLITDRGTNYLSQTFKEMCQVFGIKFEPTVAYHHSSNGQVERLVQTITQTLTAYTHENIADWSNHLQFTIFLYNTSESTTTGHSPFYLLHGRDALTPTKSQLGTSTTTYVDNPTYVEELTKDLRTAWDISFKYVQKAQQTNAATYNSRNSTSNFSIPENTLVLLRNGPNPTKLTPKWSGPYRLIRVNTPKGTIADQKGKEQEVHLDRLKRFYTLTDSPLLTDTPGKPATENEAAKPNPTEPSTAPTVLRRSPRLQARQTSPHS